jgi:DHA1 family putative efflux transporter-like MFS transporter
MSVKTEKSVKPQPARLFLPSLFLSTFTAQSGGIITSLLLIEIAQAFNTSVGVAGQLRTLQSTIATIFAVFMGLLSIRFDHKQLYVSGILLVALSYISCFFAPEFNYMMLSYALMGLGLAIYAPMRTTLAGDLLPLDERPKAISVAIAGMAVPFLVGTIIIGYISQASGWRSAFLIYALPLQIISLIIAYFGVPSTSSKMRRNVKLRDYINDFKSVFVNISAVACLLGFVFSSSTWLFFTLYGMTYIRGVLGVSTSVASLFMVVTSLLFTVGSLLGGRFVGKFGRKPTTLVPVLIVGLVVMINPSLRLFSLFVALSCLGAFLGGVMFTAIRSLTVEQIPELRGTVMSLGTAGMQFGYALGSGIGGMVLILYNYQTLGLVLGGMGVLGAVILQVFAKDPTISS